MSKNLLLKTFQQESLLRRTFFIRSQRVVIPSSLNKRGRQQRLMNRKTNCHSIQSFHLRSCIRESNHRYHLGCHYSQNSYLYSRSGSNNKNHWRTDRQSGSKTIIHGKHKSLIQLFHVICKSRVTLLKKGALDPILTKEFFSSQHDREYE